MLEQVRHALWGRGRQQPSSAHALQAVVGFATKECARGGRGVQEKRASRCRRHVRERVRRGRGVHVCTCARVHVCTCARAMVVCTCDGETERG
eukprot:998019-Rhodomonas_salina.3